MQQVHRRSNFCRLGSLLLALSAATVAYSTFRTEAQIVRTPIRSHGGGIRQIYSRTLRNPGVVLNPMECERISSWRRNYPIRGRDRHGFALQAEENQVESIPEEAEAELDPEEESVAEEPVQMQKLFAVIEMAESPESIAAATENSPELKQEQDAYLKDLMDKGLIISSGNFESQEVLTGVWIAKADSLESALRIRDNSPYWTAGIIPNTIVRQWNAIGDLVSDTTVKQLDEAKQELAELKQLRSTEAAKAESYASQVAKVQDAYARVMNDFTTYKTRTDREKEMAIVEGKRAAVRKLLPMIDAFGSAFEMISPQSEGEQIIDEAYRSLYDQMIQIFKSEGLEELGFVGESFDAELHEAMELQETEEFPDGAITKVFRVGFKLGDQLVRPAYVQVASNPADAAAKEAAAKLEAEAASKAEAEAREESTQTENKQE
mmetsp:Transcript_28233/g.68688  ORF Transcript_28233/g.68688 Transcript_28233/m.68688 type:complete len:435 (+) Transcript_28233:135-1439(+)